MSDQPIEQVPELDEVPDSELAIHTPPSDAEGTEGIVFTVLPVEVEVEVAVPRQEA